jgi:hypothetical protein
MWRFESTGIVPKATAPANVPAMVTLWHNRPLLTGWGRLKYVRRSGNK